LKKLLISTFLILGQFAWADITTNRQLWIDFDDRYNDQSDVGRTVTIDGKITYITGVHNKAGVFPGLAYLSFYDSPAGTDNVSSLSWAVWVKRPDLTTHFENALFKSSVFKLRVDYGASGEWDGYVIDSDHHQVWLSSSNQAAETTEWTHIAMTVDLANSNNTIIWYINGNPVDTIHPSLFSDLLNDTDDSGTVAGNGIIMDDLMVWDRVLDPTEVYQLSQFDRPTLAPTPTATDTPTITVTPTDAATVIQTITPTMTNTPTPTPTEEPLTVYEWSQF